MATGWPMAAKTQEQLVSGMQLRAQIQEALKQVSPELREAVILRDLEDMDYKDIAEVLGVPQGTVKSRISRGRAELAKRTKPCRRAGDVELANMTQFEGFEDRFDKSNAGQQPVRCAEAIVAPKLVDGTCQLWRSKAAFDVHVASCTHCAAGTG